ncbi:hypothetical protein [Demequina sp.]|uniref:hypothetical protein n=1 Tax=Demequina sp. TaxID=2050685 RepID=UPI0025C6921A|nr:hypothetical protein [Demequina sp.]
MFKLNLKALLARGSDEGFYAPGAEPTKLGWHRKTVDVSVEVFEADRVPQHETPTLTKGFGTSASWGVW